MKIRLGVLRRVVRESIADVVRASGVESMWDNVPPPAVGPATQRIAAVDHGADGDADGYCDVCFPEPCGCGGADDDATAGVLLVVGGDDEGAHDDDDELGGFGPFTGDDDLPIDPVGPTAPPAKGPAWAVRG